MDDSTVAQVSNEFLDYQYEILGIKAFMASPDVTEICINRPGELYLERRDGWRRIEVPTLTFDRYAYSRRPPFLPAPSARRL